MTAKMMHSEVEKEIRFLCSDSTKNFNNVNLPHREKYITPFDAYVFIFLITFSLMDRWIYQMSF